MTGLPATYTPSALYETTGMPASIALDTTEVNPVALVTVVEIPPALAAIAVFM